jgi:hypothetical protein
MFDRNTASEQSPLAINSVNRAFNASGGKESEKKDALDLWDASWVKTSNMANTMITPNQHKLKVFSKRHRSFRMNAPNFDVPVRDINTSDNHRTPDPKGGLCVISSKLTLNNMVDTLKRGT